MKKPTPKQCLQCGVYGYCNNNLVARNQNSTCRYFEQDATQSLNIHMNINM
jgi:hypothetical protein